MRNTRKNIIQQIKQVVSETNGLEIMGDDEQGSKSIVYVRDLFKRSLILVWVMSYRTYIKVDNSDPLSYPSNQTEDALAYIKNLAFVMT